MNPYIPLAVLTMCISGLAAADILTTGVLSESSTTTINTVAGAALAALGWRAVAAKSEKA